MSDELVAAIDRLTAEIKRYNDIQLNPPLIFNRERVADFGKASYEKDRDDKEALETLLAVKRPPSKSKG